MHLKRLNKDGKEYEVATLINDWIDVQENQYRYQAIDDAGAITIRIVISEYLACEAVWENLIEAI